MMAASFIGGGNRSTCRKHPTYRKSLTNFRNMYLVNSIHKISHDKDSQEMLYSEIDKKKSNKLLYDFFKGSPFGSVYVR